MQPEDYGIGRLFWTLQDAVIVADAATGRITLWNPAAESMFGHSAGEVVGRPLEIIIPERLRAAHRAGLARFHREGRGPLVDSSTPFEVPAVRRDGTEIAVELTLNRVTLDGDDRHVLAVLRDVTERRRATDELARLGRRYELLLAAVDEGIFGLDPDGITTFVNPSAERLTGYAAADMVGHRQHAHVHHAYPDGRPYPVEACPIHATLATGQTHRVRGEVFWRKDGTAIPVEYTSTPVIEGGRVVGAVVTFRDVSERLRAEAEQLRRIEEAAARVAAEASARRLARL